MKVAVRYYGRLRELAGRERREVELDGEPATVGELAARLAEQDFRDPGELEGVAYSVGDELVGAERRLSDGDEVGLLPPVSGG